MGVSESVVTNEENIITGPPLSSVASNLATTAAHG